MHGRPSLIALALLLLAVAPLAAKTARRTCVQACGALLAECNTQQPTRRARNRCRAAIIRMCRKHGVATCEPPPSTTTTTTAATTTTGGRTTTIAPTTTTTTTAGAPTTTTTSTSSTTTTTAGSPTTTTTSTSSTTTTTISASALSLLETAVGGTPTGVAAVEVFLAPEFAGGYANVVIDLDRDGLEPDADPAQGGDWWVQNFPIVISGGSPTGAVAMTFTLGSIVPSGNYDVYASFTATPVASPSVATMVLTPQVPFGAHDIGTLQSGTSNGRTAGGARTTVARASGPRCPTTAVDWLVSGGRALVERVLGRAQAAGPNGDVRLNIPGILQGENECAPTAAAQSLLWQSDTQGLQGVPPQDLLIDELKRAMEPTWASGAYPGIDFANFVPGKDTVVQDLKLPINTVSDGSPGAAGTFDFIRAQIEANADVELRIAYDSGGGHAVTVAGWYDDGTVQKLCFKDPLTGGNTVDCYDIEGSTIASYKYGGASIDSAVAESIVTTTTTTTTTQPYYCDPPPDTCYQHCGTEPNPGCGCQLCGTSIGPACIDANGGIGFCINDANCVISYGAYYNFCNTYTNLCYHRCS